MTAASPPTGNFTLVQRDPAKLARMDRYVEWLLLPESEREPTSKRMLAEELGVTPQTLRNYDRDPWLQRELIQRGRAIARVQDIPSVLASLKDQALDETNPRSVAAAKVWLEWISRSAEPEHTTDISELSDSDLHDLLLATLEAKE